MLPVSLASARFGAAQVRRRSGRPLAFASLKLQRDVNSLADVVVCYLDIFTGFSARPFGTRSLVKQVEHLMLLALFLHPVYRKAAQKLLNKTPLTTIGSLCRIGVYYYRRFTYQEPGNLGEDLYEWIKGRLPLLPEGGFSSISSFWDFMRDDMPMSKLPKLAMLVLSIVVNTATCERYFSELALIHTAKRNKMSVEKARKIAAVRKKVREADQLDGILKSQRIKKLANPTERPRRQDERFERNPADNEDESDDETASELGSDDAFEYWGAVLAELDGDDDMASSNSSVVANNAEVSGGEVSSSSNFTSFSTPTDESNSDNAARKEREFRDKVSEIAHQSEAAIPEPIKQPFPSVNDRNFPQE
ncbi:Ribonuclease H-like domain [Phytophthora cactorum]|nr:Ribonuclease H-like domain [Phytophthora cactorum]